MFRRLLSRWRQAGTAARMRLDWDRRASENSRYYIADCRSDWTEEDFYRSGEQTVEADILSDMENICQGKEPASMRVLEIGCGAGRVTRALAGIFGDVHAVDISAEMVRQAREAVRDFPNAHVYRNNGVDLRVVPDLPFDFAYSTCVFHHIPSREIIEGYVREVNRLLRPGCLFKFEVQGSAEMGDHPGDTWLGAPFTAEQAVRMAVRCNFDPRYRYGEGQERFWLWFFRWP
jgi:SAM-dependent methyltransferase